MSAFKQIPAFAKNLPRFEDHERQTVRHSTCYMCACRCGIRVTLEDGRIRFIQGTPGHPVNNGVICAKGSAGIMKQYSRARLRNPLRRRRDAERGEAAFEEISWDEALDELTARLKHIRATDPRKLAYFTGRDQMQALSGLWAREFGTVNWAAHGGFCSVNMAAAGLYTTGHSFWEFGEPDFERTRIRSSSASTSSSAGARSSSRSIPCARATRRWPTSGCRSARARTACSPWR